MHAEELNKHERLGGAAAERSKYCLRLRKVDDDSSAPLPFSLQYAVFICKVQVVCDRRRSFAQLEIHLPLISVRTTAE